MSEEQLKSFVIKVQTDSSLQEQLKAEGADPVAIAKAAGFTIKLQDLQDLAGKLSDEAGASESMSLEDLEAINGGYVSSSERGLAVCCAAVLGGAIVYKAATYERDGFSSRGVLR